MPKIRMIQPGYEGFNGQFGIHEFVDGVSVETISPLEATVLAGLIQFETVPEVEGEVPVNPSYAQKVLDERDTQLAAGSFPTADEQEVAVAEFGPADTKVYTEAELEAIADAGGIKAVRKISDPLGLKATSIAALIAGILKLQPKPEVAESGAEILSEAEPEQPKPLDVPVDTSEVEAPPVPEDTPAETPAPEAPAEGDAQE
jgi:hypothetical protein